MSAYFKEEAANSSLAQCFLFDSIQHDEIVFEWCEHDAPPENGDSDGDNGDSAVDIDDHMDVQFEYDVTATDVDGGGLGRGGWDGSRGQLGLGE